MMPDEPTTAEQILVILADNPVRIATLISDLTPAQLQARPATQSWTANDLLAHLRSCADVWGGCIATMLAEDNPTIRIVSPRTWLRSTNYPELEFQFSWNAFIEQRTNLLLALNSLSNGDWLRPAVAKDSRRTLNRTVQFYGQLLARHEHSHLEQFRQIAEAILT
jgi:hypothetical protein